MAKITQKQKESIENCLYMFGVLVIQHGMPIRDSDVKQAVTQIKYALEESNG